MAQSDSDVDVSDQSGFVDAALEYRVDGDHFVIKDLDCPGVVGEGDSWPDALRNLADDYTETFHG